MKQISTGDVEICNLNMENNKTDVRAFSYVLSDKKAKDKLLKGAKRAKNLEVEEKDGCITFIFNDGSYIKTLIPLLKSWQRNTNKTVAIDSYQVNIEESGEGLDNSQKHIDTKLVIYVDNSRFVLYAYNQYNAKTDDPRKKW